MKTYSSTAQCSQVLAYLLRFKNRWIPMPELAKISGSYAINSRAAELRKRGHTILNRVTQGKHSVKCSEYKLVPKISKQAPPLAMSGNTKTK